MKIISSAFENNQMIPQKYTCDGENISPSLEIFDVPKNARSLALICNDSDAPSGDFIHWLVWNIAPETRKIDEGTAPEGAILGITSSGQSNYASPCPPTGVHHYHFKLFALDAKLNLSQSAGKSELLKAAQNHILAEAELVGLYQRQ